ncbi:MAG TPA: YbaB/EbfC family nucleoid-associated protein [Acidimicrobiales bacterium]|nr:YbaB/EbfC family nucleoid-associated protein [Acidimicrobiales bacterium]
MSDQFDLGALLEQAKALQAQLEEAQETAAQQVVEGQAGGGLVKVQISGSLHVEAVTIDSGAIDPDDVTLLEDLVVAAVNDGLTQAQNLTRNAIGDIGLGGPTGLLGQ